MAIAAQENQFQHRVRHAGTVWAHYMSLTQTRRN